MGKFNERDYCGSENLGNERRPKSECHIYYILR